MRRFLLLLMLCFCMPAMAEECARYGLAGRE